MFGGPYWAIWAFEREVRARVYGSAAGWKAAQNLLEAPRGRNLHELLGRRSFRLSAHPASAPGFRSGTALKKDGMHENTYEAPWVLGGGSSRAS